MENLIYSLIVAAVSALTFLAYKHPSSYKKMYKVLWIDSLRSVGLLGSRA